MYPNKNNVSSHKPVLIDSLIKVASPVHGTWIDCTFGAGGYTEALLKSGAERVIGIDRDPNIFLHAEKLKIKYQSRIEISESNFSSLKNVMTQYPNETVTGIVFDVGVSSMQIDTAERGFSFQKDGPLDMRMSQKGISASDIVNNANESELADIIYFYGEDRAARLIARSIIVERKLNPILRTEHLSALIEKVVRRPNFSKKKLAHPATLTFQALRIAVNNELAELKLGLLAAEQILPEGALLAVVSFHSLEDRLVKHFIKSRSTSQSGQSRYYPDSKLTNPTFKELFNKVITATDEEIEKNPRARSAKLRVARRLSAPCQSGASLDIIVPTVKLRIGGN
jgi:16S rRNA (cytosine1402-N4)-methyltransferase